MIELTDEYRILHDKIRSIASLYEQTKECKLPELQVNKNDNEVELCWIDLNKKKHISFMIEDGDIILSYSHECKDIDVEDPDDQDILDYIVEFFE